MRMSLKFWLPVFAVVAARSEAKDIDFQVTNPADGAVLVGTLAVPDGKPKAVITLATGSGQQERDEPIFGYRPFKVLSDSLVNAGYAVLRMDDRGAGKSTGPLDDYTTATYIGDVRIAMQKLDSIYPDLPKGIIGHSEGGMVAYRIAASDEPCDFIVTLAAPSWPGDSLILSQGKAMSIYLTGSYEGEETERQFLDIVKSDTPPLLAYPQLWTLFSLKLGDTMKFPGVQEQMTQQVQVALSPWYRDFVRYNPAEDIRKVSIPWLALNGDRDFQVLPGNLTTIKDLNSNVQTVLLADHNHLFQNTKTGIVTDYDKDGECPTPETIKCIIEWLPSAIENSRKGHEYSMLQWNIWQEGTMVKGGYGAIVAEIHRLKPDFVTLSEVRNYNGIDFTDRLVKDLAEFGDTYYTVRSRDSGILSLYPIEQFDTLFPWEQDHGSVYRFLTTTDRGDKFAVTTAHLDYLNCASYEPRGYSGNTWEECDIPASAEEVIRLNDLSLRDEAIRQFIAVAEKDLEKGYTVLIGGDFNEPSYLDWQENTASIRDHAGFCGSLDGDESAKRGRIYRFLP